MYNSDHFLQGEAPNIDGAMTFLINVISALHAGRDGGTEEVRAFSFQHAACGEVVWRNFRTLGILGLLLNLSSGRPLTRGVC